MKQLLNATPTSGVHSPVWKHAADAAEAADAATAFGLVQAPLPAAATSKAFSASDGQPVADARPPEPPRTPNRAPLDASRTAIVRPLSMAVSGGGESTARVSPATFISPLSVAPNSQVVRAQQHLLPSGTSAVPVLSSTVRHSGVFPGTPLESSGSTVAQVGGVAPSFLLPTDTNLDEDLEDEPQPRFVHHPRRNPPPQQQRPTNQQSPAGGAPRLQLPASQLPITKLHYRASTAGPVTGGTHYVLFSARAHQTPNPPPPAASPRPPGDSSENLKPESDAAAAAAAGRVLPTSTSAEYASSIPNSAAAIWSGANSNGRGSPRGVPAMGAASKLLTSSKQSTSWKRTDSPDVNRVCF